MYFPYVSIIIPAFNEEKYIAECLSALSRSDYPHNKVETIVVDNGSTDRTKVIAQQFGVYLVDKPLGNVGAVRNCGVRASRGEIVIFLDADCLVDEGWLKRGVKLILENDNFVFGGQYLLKKDPSWLERYWILNDEDGSVHQSTLVGGAIFIGKEQFEAVGGFDESLSAGEDSELTERLKVTGHKVVIKPSLSVVHLGYPNTVESFLKRQVWHSSDYVNQFPASLRDKVFILTLAFIVGGFSLLIFLFSWYSAFAYLSLLTFLTPFILSVKRISRSGKRSYCLKDFLSIYVVDFLYLVGRSGGVLKGVGLRAFSSLTCYFARRS